MDQYLEATTVHGFRYVHSSNHFCQRFAWLLMIVAGFSTAAWMIDQVMTDWAENPVITTIDSISAPIKYVQFPTVTVCPDPKQSVDNWGYLEKLLNAVEFACYDNCPRTQKVRDEIADPITNELVKAALAMHFNNPASPIWYNYGSLYEGQKSWYSKVIVETAIHLANKKFSAGDIANGVVKEFLKGTSFEKILHKLANYSDCDFGCFEPSCNKACESQRILATSYLDVSELLLNSQQNIPLGLYVSSFANLTGTKIGSLPTWSSLDDTLISTVSEGCSKMSTNEKYLHKYFSDLGLALGFELNETISLFDIPAIFGHEKEDYDLKKSRNMFIYSQCIASKKEPSLLSSNSDCYAGIWDSYTYNCKLGGKVDACCNYWSKWAGNKLLPLMKIMRMAVRRGQSHFNITNFLSPFKNNPNVMRYTVINYTDDMQMDTTSYLPYCSYIQSPDKPFECNIFQPVVTDLGICYAFNAESTLGFLKEGSFKETFLEAYGSELEDTLILKGQGSGAKNSLDFFIDSSKMKRKLPAKDFLVAVTSANQYFEANSLAKNARPGYIKVFDIAPIEVVATNGLVEIPLSQRKCKLPNESEGSKLFQKYSQSSCEFECRIQFASDQCNCIPWDIPRFDGLKSICDVFGNTCFYAALNHNDLHECDCLPDCNDVRFSVNEQEFKTNVEDYCSEVNGLGHKIVLNKLSHGLDGLFYKQKMYFELSNSSLLPGTEGLFSKKQIKLCKELFETEIAIVSVRFETKKYIRSIKDKKVTFGDKLGAFGGTLGLFTGMSFLSMAEIIFWIFKLVPRIFLGPK